MYFLTFLDQTLTYLYIIPAALIAIILHEFAHGAVSYMLGDVTPKEEGRLSLNPMKHIDPVGLLCLVLFHFGWAKPVRINSYAYKNKRLGIFLVSIAGPLMNFIVGILSTLLCVLVVKFNGSSVIYELFIYIAIINFGLGVFNLIPIPPLDGSKVLASFLPEHVAGQYLRYEKYGMILILGLLVLSNLFPGPNGMSLLSEMVNYIYRFFLNIWINVCL